MKDSKKNADFPKTRSNRKDGTDPLSDTIPTRKEKGSLTWDELKRVLACCETVEEEALIKLAVTTGIRREDIALVELSNIDLEHRTLKFWEEKKNRAWTVALEPETCVALKKLIATKPKGTRYLFEFTGRTAYNWFQTIQKRAGVNKELEFHALRRTFIRLSRRMGRDMRFVMEQTGDTAETILEEYEGYSLDEMTEMMNRDVGGVCPCCGRAGGRGEGAILSIVKITPGSEAGGK